MREAQTRAETTAQKVVREMKAEYDRVKRKLEQMRAIGKVPDMGGAKGKPPGSQLPEHRQEKPEGEAAEGEPAEVSPPRCDARARRAPAAGCGGDGAQTSSPKRLRAAARIVARKPTTEG